MEAIVEVLTFRTPDKESRQLREEARRLAYDNDRLRARFTDLERDLKAVRREFSEQRVSLTEIGVQEVRTRKTALGGRVLEIGGPERNQQADRLAEELRGALEGIATVNRPVKSADVRISGLEDSVTVEDVVAAIAAKGECPSEQVRTGLLVMGSLIITCPVTTARAITQGRLCIGWSVARVILLEGRPLRCFRCYGTGHCALACTAKNRSGLCCRCGKKGHKILDIALKSGNLKGGYVRDLKIAAKDMTEMVEVLMERTAEKESRQLRDEARRLSNDNNRLRARGAIIKKVVEGLKGDLAKTIGEMKDAKLAGIEDRLLPAPVVWPPLEAATRQVERSTREEAPQGPPVPAANPQADSWTKVAARGKKKRTQPAPTTVNTTLTAPANPASQAQAGIRQIRATESAKPVEPVKSVKPTKGDGLAGSPKAKVSLRPPSTAAVVITLSKDAVAGGATYAWALTAAKQLGGHRGEGAWLCRSRLGPSDSGGVYFPPNRPLREFEGFLGCLGPAIRRARSLLILVMGDFNCRSRSWGDTMTGVRSAPLVAWAAELGLVVLNTGGVATCVRPQGASIVDITLASREASCRVTGWRVVEDVETLSPLDFKRAMMSLSDSSMPRWKRAPRRTAVF
ncbi:unnamed protein product [Leptidea sinapis]|uniref:Endonuclease/exonuclease/phosphatase domain-containing protein n=1 Tax=Leptidea sinapis TaxID=189913 RepID=A0A5E4R1M3_9NEOP|nr:unnamed protein product [Leptidea sinapis]